MKYQAIAALAPMALLLSACTTVQPAYKDIGTRMGPCVDGGPDSVAQQFYDLRLKEPTQGMPTAQQLAKYRPYLSDKLYATLLKANSDTTRAPELNQGDIFSSLSVGPTSASVADASTIPNTDARNIPLRVTLTRDGSKPVEWQDEVLMVREGTCWAVDDVRYNSPNPHLQGGSLSQLLLK
ncbi:lipoprotein [Erwinia billingiae]|jgi:predicted small secreted protein|uniref:Putative lipoprotein YbjP n=1 Tax=Erwinia billingiae (strain Eb661) TaxID=634500 RepID=D8MQA1_ERWBE|nr:MULTISPECIES: lipoprotein [Erwinia]MBN7121686.1 lipoprotein [Erwinia billingiae]QBR51150.1 lipoprotein [Erwinia sp. QL-Z3]QEW32880.1 lipoprotein [Erwinia billingiae]CAX59008.1 Putative lipoprotein YbjP [Erwinia billingiae Eb661]